MNKITPEHLARDAYVYVRQSTADQLAQQPREPTSSVCLKSGAKLSDGKT